MKYIAKLLTTFIPLVVFFLMMAIIAMSRAQAGVYVTDRVDAVAAFCHAVTTTRDVFCPRARVNCRTIKKKRVAAFITTARKCLSGPGSIPEAEAARLMKSYQQNQSALCCMPLNGK